MEEIISKEEFDRLMGINEKTIGFAILEHAEVIKKEQGEEGLARIEKAITAMGYPFKYKNLKKIKYYPLGLEALHLMKNKLEESRLAHEERGLQ